MAMAVIATLFGAARAVPASASTPQSGLRVAAEDGDGVASTDGAEADTTTEDTPSDDATESTTGDSSADGAGRVATRSKYRVSSGVTLNNPIGPDKVKFAIINKIHGAITHAPRGSHIWIMSWNVMWQSSVKKILAAQKRGVVIRVLMDSGNASAEVPNRAWRLLRAGLAKYNKAHPKAAKSQAKVCKGACRRSSGGQAHAKFFLFEKAGASKYVVMQGGNNLTLASAINQWNDMYTHTGNVDLYRFMVQRYKEMWKDRNPKKQWMGYTDNPKFKIYLSPRGTGFGKSETSDPLLKTLNATKCKGANGGAGNGNGRTVIRVAPDVLRGVTGSSWGWKVAYRLRQLWNAGCDVKVGYTIMGKEIYQLLKRGTGRGAVPMRHLVQDFNGDKEFDRYFHLKVWTINGVIGSDKSAYWMMNGSSNVSPMGAKSDENIGVYRPASIVKRYQKHVEYWFNNPPPSARVVPSRIKGPVDPYRNVDLD